MSKAMRWRNTTCLTCIRTWDCCRPSSLPLSLITQPVFFGVADDGYYFYALNSAVQFPIVALDRNEKVLNGVSARVQVIKHEYRTVLTKNGSYFRYESQREDKLINS